MGKIVEYEGRPFTGCEYALFFRCGDPLCSEADRMADIFEEECHTTAERRKGYFNGDWRVYEIAKSYFLFVYNENGDLTFKGTSNSAEALRKKWYKAAYSPEGDVHAKFWTAVKYTNLPEFC